MKTGSTVEGCYVDVDRARTAHAEHLDPHLTADWATGSAGVAAAAAWQSFVTQLAVQVRDLGRSLTTAAREFEAADERAAGRVHDASAGIPAGHPAQGRAHGYHP
jgi:hypothetical protein